MGQQQLLLIILGILIIGVAIAVGITTYNTWSIKSNKDALMADINLISATAYGYYQRPRIMGGGEGNYSGFVAPASAKSNEDGDIDWEVDPRGKSISFTATSRYGFGTVQAVMNDTGELTNFVFTGEF